jgi:hypothetical protein
MILSGSRRAFPKCNSSHDGHLTQKECNPALSERESYDSAVEGSLSGDGEVCGAAFVVGTWRVSCIG